MHRCRGLCLPETCRDRDFTDRVFPFQAFTITERAAHSKIAWRNPDVLLPVPLIGPNLSRVRLRKGIHLEGDSSEYKQERSHSAVDTYR